MSKRKLNPADYGFTEEAWVALDDYTRSLYRYRAHYQRNKERRKAYQREYTRRMKGAIDEMRASVQSSRDVYRPQQARTEAGSVQ